MDFNDNASQAEWRKEVATFLAAEKPKSDPDATPQEMMERGRSMMKEWRGKLSAKGWVAPAWPKEYGGAGLGVMEQFIMNEEFAEARAMNVGGMGTSMIGPTIIIHGNDEQKAEHLGAILRGEVQWCQGYSEPGSGSDLASLQTRAVRDGDDFVINGQKIWTSGAHNADRMFMLARTDPDAPKHRGITYFLMDMKSPGVTVRPLINLAGGHMFNEVFFEDVRVPARNVLGEINRGWYIGTTTLDFERSSIGNAVGQRQTLEYYMKFWKENQGTAATGSASTKAKDEFADRWIEAAVAKMLSYVVITIQSNGRVPNHEASIAKLFNTELSQRIARTAMKMTGTNGLLLGGKAPMRGRAPQSYMQTLSSTIAGGTSEVQRNIVATRGLGLPRA
ncbi:acyl-CoA dehydrogenase family protein [Candidatus Amarobacter glycogenicus]|uniref:acyl-CoA dehydrogenase family protein n=1 Tax=Candidatus Amarobacter glycogenicus TaxID=3140699 RepID=UPI00313753D8|nr:acyl-CoA dehydrogenase family protein [Dehalococcoidia bacterium]